MKLFALVEADDPLAIDVFVNEKLAAEALLDVLRDEPKWAPFFSVVEIEISESQFFCPN
ncbi:MAG: hypothetical protein MSC30_11855 [Gaiellaceae bacterium MAG52_C11]|nr:hypothetical protein [Candidatus Gaiellasilicea maunaloa]